MTTNPHNELLNYFKKNLSKGYTLESLKIALVKQGYSSVSISRALKEINEELAKKAPVFKEKPKIKYEIIDENDNPIEMKKSIFKRIFR